MSSQSLKNGNKKENTELVDVIKKEFDYIQLAKRIIAQQPLFYDENGLWYYWDWENLAWFLLDEVAVLNQVYYAMDSANFLNYKEKILTALKMEARKYQPVLLPKTWIQFGDCAIDIESGKRFAPSKEYFFANPTPYTLGSSEDTPVIDSLFVSWVGQSKVKLLQQIASYCLIPDYPIHRLFVLFGSGRNGKGCFFKFIENLIGASNICSTSLERIHNSRFETAKLFGKTAAFIGETNFTILRDTALLKSLTGQDLMSAEFKGKKPFDFRNNAKILIASNSVPVTLDKTAGFFSRPIVVIFPNRFDNGADIIKTIPKHEYENFYLKACRLLKELLQTGKFDNEGSIEDRQKSYEDVSDPLSRFIKEKCIQEPNASVIFWKFYDAYVTFLHQNGYREQTKKEVGQLLADKGFEDVVRWHDFEGESKQWHTILGLSVTDVTDVTHISLSSPYKKIEQKSDNIDNIDNKDSQRRLDNL